MTPTRKPFLFLTTASGAEETLFPLATATTVSKGRQGYFLLTDKKTCV